MKKGIVGTELLWKKWASFLGKSDGQITKSRKVWFFTMPKIPAELFEGVVKSVRNPVSKLDLYPPTSF